MITAVAGHTVELIVTEANSGLEPDLASALQASGVRVSPWSIRVKHAMSPAP